MPEIPDWINLEKEVVQINYNSNKNVTIVCKDGAEYLCDHTICTVSLGVLKEKFETLFVPPLPTQKIKAIKVNIKSYKGFRNIYTSTYAYVMVNQQFLEIGSVNKLHFDFPNKWWPDDVIGFNLLWDPQVPLIHYSSNVTEDGLLVEIDGVFSINSSHELVKMESSYCCSFLVFSASIVDKRNFRILYISFSSHFFKFLDYWAHSTSRRKT